MNLNKVIITIDAILIYFLLIQNILIHGHSLMQYGSSCIHPNGHIQHPTKATGKPHISHSRITVYRQIQTVHLTAVHLFCFRGTIYYQFWKVGHDILVYPLATTRSWELEKGFDSFHKLAEFTANAAL